MEKVAGSSPAGVTMKTCLACEGNWPAGTKTRWHSSDLVETCDICNGTCEVPEDGSADQPKGEQHGCPGVSEGVCQEPLPEGS